MLTELLPHQIIAVNKLMRVKVGALYMEMGTGKTRTALELINKRMECGKVNHVIWLCPCSVKENLRRDILKHTGYIPKGLTICGIETLSSSIRANSELLNLVEDKNCYLIVDESNLVKNHQAIRTKNIIRLSEKCKYKLILNGTPITRNEADLFAQWYILDWRILGYKSYWSFANNHLQFDEKSKRITKTLNVPYLVKKISPYSYQVKKSECLNLPSKTSSTRYFDLLKEQDEHYEEIANIMIDRLSDYKPTTVYRMFSALQNITSGYKVNIDGKLTRKPFFEDYNENPRIKLLKEILNRLGDYKVIIFCKYTDEILNICSILGDKAVPYYGELNQKKRQENIDIFSTSAQYFVANKTCAGYGLNLQFCNYVIYYNNDFDYGTRAQSEDRVHRIGQNSNVHIIDICADYTLDERILKCLSRKEDLVDNMKNELENQKDKNQYLKEYVRYRSRVVDRDDLIEDGNLFTSQEVFNG